MVKATLSAVLGAIVLSALVLIGWQVFFGLPQVEKQQSTERAQ